MRTTFVRLVLCVAALVAPLLLVGCSRKTAQAPPPPAPAPTPTVALSASPETIRQGQSSTLTWSSRNATAITISGLGTVAASGSRTVSPTESTTYNLGAKGPGGTADASARVTVSRMAAVARPDDELFNRGMKDIFFDFDKYTIRSDQAPISQADAAYLKSHPEITIVVEGHCDDRGSEEYNLGLGDNRANTLKAELVKMGIASDRIKAISYGKEKPFCSEDNEQCWQSNRRDHVVLASQ
jgi:peptidoglycan-associated lipoprotein